jgi:hypothetical protein
MRKYLSFTLLVLFGLLALNARAQNLHEDSVKKIAIADARKFKLDKARLVIFRNNARQLERDYFNPIQRPGLHLPGWRPAAGVNREDMPGRGGFKAYRRSRELTSDFFKPVPLAVSDTALLRDSVYVKTYREEAWKRTRRRRTFGHYALVTGAVVGSATVIAAFVFSIDKAGQKR